MKKGIYSAKQVIAIIAILLAAGFVAVILFNLLRDIIKSVS